MEESILMTIKSMLGISDEDTAFDNDVLVNINAVFSTLYQIGVGSETHYFIIDKDSTWEDVFSEEKDLVDFIKLYVYMKVRVVFDPPTNSSIMEALKSQIQEIEYRIMLQADPSNYFDSNSSHHGNKYKVSFEKVPVLPEVGEANVVYLVPNGGSDDNVYDEYFWMEDESKFELLGSVNDELIFAQQDEIDRAYDNEIKPNLEIIATIK